MTAGSVGPAAAVTAGAGEGVGVTGDAQAIKLTQTPRQRPTPLVGEFTCRVSGYLVKLNNAVWVVLSASTTTSSRHVFFQVLFVFHS